jgi:hypothetical protein
VGPAVTDARHQQRKKLHGPLLGAISAQVWVEQGEGSRERYDAGTWKTWFKRLFKVPGSTEDLSNEDFERFVWAVEIFAATRMNVQFQEQGGAHDAA